MGMKPPVRCDGLPQSGYLCEGTRGRVLRPGGQEMAMAVMGGSSAAEVDVPLERVRAFVQDVERAPRWQGGLTAMRALERDEDGRAVLCRAEADARVRTVRSVCAMCSKAGAC